MPSEEDSEMNSMMMSGEVPKRKSRRLKKLRKKSGKYTFNQTIGFLIFRRQTHQENDRFGESQGSLIRNKSRRIDNRTEQHLLKSKMISPEITNF